MINKPVLFLFGLLACLVFTGCEKTPEQAVPSKSLYWTEPGAEEWMIMDIDALVMQFSADPVVYASHILPDRKLTEIEQEEGIIVRPSALSDIPQIIEAYKAVQSLAGRTVAVVIAGDDRAPCSSVLTGIDCAKRANIEWIIFETNNWRESGMAFKTALGCITLKYFEFPENYKIPADIAKNIATITIPDTGKIEWNGTQVTLDDLVRQLNDYAIRIGQENTLLVVRVDADTPFTYLRYALDQIRRCGINKVMIAPRNAPSQLR